MPNVEKFRSMSDDPSAKHAAGNCSESTS
jgi:hypothetical protein